MSLSNKERYKVLCDNESTIPIFSHYKWLNAVCGEENWNVCLVENKNNEIIGTLPYYIKIEKGFKRIVLPKLTQKLGPWIKYPDNQKYEAKLSYEQKVQKELISLLPKFDEFYQKIDYNYTNLLSFYWLNFKLTVYYTYRITDLSVIEIDEGLKLVRSNIRREIKKAKKKKIQIKTSSDIETFYKINKKTFERQNIKIPYSFEFIKSLDASFEDNRRIYFATDENNKIHAVAYIIWDKECAYYIMGGGDPELRNSGATSLLMWIAINEMAEFVNVFDFEGSMIQPVERFFRGFGAQQIPYYGVSRVDSSILKGYYFLKEIMS